MIHFASPTFWRAFEKLPAQIQELANKNFALLNDNPDLPSLRLKKVGPYWSVRVGMRYHALAVEIEEGLLWFWIGTHADYDRLIG